MIEKTYIIGEDPMLPEKVGLNFTEFILPLKMKDEELIPGDVIALKRYPEIQAIVQYRSAFYREGLTKLRYHTLMLVTRNPEDYIPNKYLQQGEKVFHIGSSYSQ
mgnify:CR=1 FL=1